MHITINRIPALMLALLLLAFIPVLALAEDAETQEVTVPNTPVNPIKKGRRELCLAF